MKQYIKCTVWMLALIVMLCACSNASKQNADTTDATDGIFETDGTDATDAADETHSIADLYEQAENDNIFKEIPRLAEMLFPVSLLRGRMPKPFGWLSSFFIYKLREIF